MIVYGISFNCFIFLSFEGHLLLALLKGSLIVCIGFKNAVSGDESICCEDS